MKAQYLGRLHHRLEVRAMMRCWRVSGCWPFWAKACAYSGRACMGSYGWPPCVGAAQGCVMDIVAKIRAACARGGIFAGKWALIGFTGVAAFALAVRTGPCAGGACPAGNCPVSCHRVCLKKAGPCGLGCAKPCYRWSAVARSGAAESGTGNLAMRHLQGQMRPTTASVARVWRAKIRGLHKAVIWYSCEQAQVGKNLLA